MKGAVVAIYDGDFKKALPYIYDGQEWKKAAPYIYNGTNWAPVGTAGTLMLTLTDRNSNEIYTSDNELFLVRED